MVLDAWDGRDLGDGARRLLDEKRRRRLAAPWSLAELELDDRDAELLIGWLARLGAREFAAHAGSGRVLFGLDDGTVVSHEEALGLMLLATFAEHARRTSGGGGLWPRLATLPSEWTRAALFSEQPSPRVEVTQAIAAAARRLQLRHALDEHDTHRWFRTVMLQVGFADGDCTNLPRWLDGVRPLPVALEQLVFGPAAAVSVTTAYDALRRVRRRRASRDEAWRALERCPFVRPSLRERLVDAALVAASAEPHGDSVDGGDAFTLGPMGVRWPAGAAPQTLLTIGPVRHGGAGKLRVSVDGVRRAWLYPTPEGHCPAGERELELVVPFAARHVLEVNSTQSDDGLEQVVEWSDEDAFFEASGAPTGAATPSILVTRRRVVRVPEAADTRIVIGDVTLVRVGHGARVLCLDDDQEVWPRSAPALGVDLDVRVLESVVDGEDVRVALQLPGGARVRQARVGSVLWRTTESNPGCVHAHGTVPPASARGWTRLTLALDVEGRRLQRTVKIGGYTRLADTAEWVREDAVLSKRSLKRLRCCFGPELVAEDGFLVAGARVHRCRDTGHVDFDPVCLGEPLDLSIGPPWHERSVRRRLARSLVDGGRVAALRSAPGELALELTEPLEVTPEFWLCVWPADGSVVGLPITSSESTHVRAEWHGGEVRAAALAFRTAWLGAAWNPGWSEGLDPRDPLGHWATMRALRLPVLSESRREDLVALAQRDPGALTLSMGCAGANSQLAVGERRLDGMPLDRWRDGLSVLGLSARLVSAKQRDALIDRVRALSPPDPPDAWRPLFIGALKDTSAFHPGDTCRTYRRPNDTRGWAEQMACRYRGFASLGSPEYAAMSAAKRNRELRRRDSELEQAFARRAGLHDLAPLMEAIRADVVPPHATQALFDEDFRTIAAVHLLDELRALP